ncbi:hypothetical protein V2J09_020157 [Rumex salicifolius]
MEGDRQGGDSDLAAVGVSSKENVDASVIDEQLTEDEEVDKFYALIRNYKEARERMLRIASERASVGNENYENRRKRKRSTEKGDRSGPIWIPAFKSEDFTEDYSRIKVQISPTTCPSSYKDMHGGDPLPSETDGGGLDLRLRLALNYY